MSTKQNDDASSSKSIKTADNNGPPPWSNHQDLLCEIMMKLELADFFTFGKVCKSWRSLALTHKNKYMCSRQPMSVTLPTDITAECYFRDIFEGRKIKAVIPHSTGSTCVGLTCGYLVFYSRIGRDFWLVNPFTSHELHFPNFPLEVNTDLSIFRGILVFSPSVSQWAFVFSHKFSKKISFSLSGNQASWYHLTSEFSIVDIHSFMGKIYMLTVCGRIFEVGLDSKPTLTPLVMKNFPKRQLFRLEFVCSGKNLFVLDKVTAYLYEVYEIDLEKMEWVLKQNSTVDYGFFVGDIKSSAAINPDTWSGRGMKYMRVDYLNNLERSKLKGRLLIADMWYLNFPHDCVEVNTPQLQ
ncbi:putative F-box protein [Helianthus annuus]|nr:putative F-box protein [Helianthus annuus]KAJ0461317.1 putative F-box protein [Helianthus annuus]KAJ0645626.1 putative F-box protein [Helianthus annuus]KAJ0822147.1 putative F-box domain-containing protein [Helianthus annuus]